MLSHSKTIFTIYCCRYSQQLNNYILYTSMDFLYFYFASVIIYVDSIFFYLTFIHNTLNKTHDLVTTTFSRSVEKNGHLSPSVILTLILHFLIFGKPNLSVPRGQFAPKTIDKKIEEKLEKERKKCRRKKGFIFFS